MYQEVLKNTIKELESLLSFFKKENRDVYVTSSFQTQSVPLLHIISTYFKEVKVIFLDTGFLFPETYQFKNTLEKSLGLEVITITPKISKHLQTDKDSNLFLYSIDADKCCGINKVSPLDDFWKNGDVWISGVRRDQSSIRKKMRLVEDRKGITKVHPMLEWNSKNIHDYIISNNLPKHPLEKEGYISIGCVPCTHKWSADSQRGGRWLGSEKTECGLHISKN